MTWGAIGTAVIGGAVGLYSQRQQKKQADRNAKTAGQFDRNSTSTTTRDPWAPSKDYRIKGMDFASNFLGEDPNAIRQAWGNLPTLKLPRFNAPEWEGPENGGYDAPTLQGGEVYGMLLDHYNDPYINNAMAYAEQGYQDPFANNPLLREAWNMNMQRANGPNPNDALMRSTYKQVSGSGIPEIDQLFKKWAGDTYAPQDVNVVQPNLTGAGDFLKGMMTKDYESNPYLEDVIKSASADISRANANALGNFAGSSEAAGMFGGGAFNEGVVESQRMLADEIGQMSGNLRFQDYGNWQNNQMQAANIGAGLDSASMQIASRGNDRALERMLGARGNLVDLLGLKQRGIESRNSVLGQLATNDPGMRAIEMLYQGAGMANDSKQGWMDRVFRGHETQRDDLMGASQAASSFNDAGLSLARDQASARMRGAEAENDFNYRGQYDEWNSDYMGTKDEWGAAMDRFRASRLGPYDELGAYADIINQMSGGYGSESTSTHEWGTDPTGNYGYTGPSAAQAGLGGAMSGLDMWLQWQKYRDSQNPTNTT